MRFSVQQIKYELLYAIREYDSDGSKWQIAISEVEPTEALKARGLDPEAYLFLGKPASTNRAAVLVRDFMMGRCLVQPAEPSATASGEPGDWVVMFRDKASLPTDAVVSLA
ncbi:hypothetical protein [Jiella marina]|uniref:hypothetical protein n=1 Tax=Jiella sp. LLJ827 TaxID=2917712 RepID=UPI002100CF89|nr:hypothetical protein [Jiella sp. LLJ827]MCQ0988043.1 hypothetical protein [Jiella sp. LLJ827]